MSVETSPVQENEACAIKVSGLCKTFDGYYALKDVQFQISDGETVAFFGPNGAGKTTLLKILATILSPTSGRVEIKGLDTKTKPQEVRRAIGVVSHSTFLYGNLSAYENLDFYRRIYEVPETRIKEVTEVVGMQSRLHSQVHTLSRGMQQRLSIARALLHNPSIILLDEPENGLDQQALALLWNVLKETGQTKRTIILASHNLERGLEVADRVLIISRGRLVHEGKASQITSSGLKEIYQNVTRSTL